MFLQLQSLLDMLLVLNLIDFLNLKVLVHMRKLYNLRLHLLHLH